jgi:hypothetical protein
LRNSIESSALLDVRIHVAGTKVAVLEQSSSDKVSPMVRDLVGWLFPGQFLLRPLCGMCCLCGPDGGYGRVIGTEAPVESVAAGPVATGPGLYSETEMVCRMTLAAPARYGIICAIAFVFTRLSPACI